MNYRHFLRMAKWAKKPPSAGQVKLFFLVLVVCLMLFGFERMFGWPDWLTVNTTGRGQISR